MKEDAPYNVLLFTMPIPVLGPKSGVRDVWIGLSLPFRALALIFSTGKLFVLSLLCAVVTGATLAALLVFLWPVAAHLGDRWVGSGGVTGAFGTALAVLLYAVMVVIGLLTLPNLVLAPLQDPLSEATEVKLGGFTAPPFSVQHTVRGTVTSLKHTISRLALMLLGFAVLLPLNFVPAAGSVLYGVLSALWTMWWIAAEYLSGPMARHLRPFREVLRAMRDRPWLAMGMGAALYVVLWVPVLNCFLVPLAVVAGTLLFRSLPPTPAGT
jgi:CysZ protein